MRSRTVVFKRMATVLTASLLFICVLGTSLGAAQYRLTFWNMPFVTQEVSLTTSPLAERCKNSFT